MVANKGVLMMDVATAKRCVSLCAKYLRERDDSPRAARDLEEAVQVIAIDAHKRAKAVLRAIKSPRPPRLPA